MTIIKQRAVTDKGHQKNLRAYINDDRKVLARDSQNMKGCKDLKRWAWHMEKTRERYGHNKASRKVRDKKTGKMVAARNTIMYHQILGFLPDECSCNGGKLTPEDCMRYAKEYAQKHYQNQQVVFAVHDEYCKADKTHRWAVHMVINRSDISTGKRLNEGRGHQAKVDRARRIRDMDAEWGLKQVEKDEGNSVVHKKQPSKVEKEIADRGGKSYKTNLRELCRIAAERAENIYQYRELLEGWGVDTQFRRGRLYVTDTDHERYSFSVSKLDADLNQKGLERAFRANISASIHEKGQQVLDERASLIADQKRIAQLRKAYLNDIRDAYREYRKQAKALEGIPLSDFPKLKLKRPPAEIATDDEVKRALLAYWRGADELRVEMASQVPYARKAQSSSAASTAGTGTPRGHKDRGREDERADRSEDR